MFEKFDEASGDVLAVSRHECMRLHASEVLPEHLLLALTRDPSNLAARALASMNIDADGIQKELDKAKKAATDMQGQPAQVPYEEVCFSDGAKTVFEYANNQRRYLGCDRIAPEHVLLGIVDSKDDGAMRTLEELGVNLTFLRRQVMHLIAREDSLLSRAPGTKASVIDGVSEIIEEYMQNVAHLQNLADASAEVRWTHLPTRPQVVLTVFLAFLPEFLFTQTAYQRYLLEETVKLLQRRTGSLDKETLAAIVSAAAQNLRAEVRHVIEHLWTHEYRLLNQVPDEAEHDEIGGAIEDLWWTYSEEIALHEVFDEAMEDYRRKHVLDLQKRKLEISQRLQKLRQRLDETIKQCFLKRGVPA